MPNSEEIKELISDLHQNDSPEIYSSYVEPKEPIRTMKRLMEIGHESVPYLIKELKDYKKEGVERYFPEYIVKILGEIGDLRALEELAWLANDELAGWDVDITIKSIAKLGPEVISFYLQKIEKTKSEEDIECALWVFTKLDEKDPDVLRFAKDILQQHKNFYIKDSAIDVIGIHGSQKDIELLEKYLKSKNEEMRDAAKKSLQYILKENPVKIRDVLIKHKIIGSQRCEELGRKFGSEFRSLGFRYSEKKGFVGGNASELNESVREYFSRKMLIELLYQINNFGVDEGLLSEKHKEKILEVWRDLFITQNKHIEQYRDVISIFDSYNIDVQIQSEETRSFKGLYPVPKELLQRIKKWSTKDDFETSEVTYDLFHTLHYILARKNSEKSCIIYITKTEGKRIWGDVRLTIIGKDWSPKERDDIQSSFWNQFADLTNTV